MTSYPIPCFYSEPGNYCCFLDEQFLNAAREGNLEEIKDAIQNGANIQAKEGLCNETAMHIAASHGYLVVVEFLIAEKADMLDNNCVDMTPIHIAARVSAMASGGDILVSRTVKDLVAGSGIEFEDFGTHELKGIPDEHQIFKVLAV